VSEQSDHTSFQRQATLTAHRPPQVVEEVKLASNARPPMPTGMMQSRPGLIMGGGSAGRPYERGNFERDMDMDEVLMHQQNQKKRKRDEATLVSDGADSRSHPTGSQFGGSRVHGQGRDAEYEEQEQETHQYRLQQLGNQNLPRGVQIVSVSRGQLSGAMKSKLDMYNVLAIEGQLYLPPLDHCPMEFIKQVMAGHKKVSAPASSPRPHRCSTTTS
jgi:hypothetical protein